MPINFLTGDLLKSEDAVIAHCCNCFCVMGAGVAKAIKNKYPQVYAADTATEKGAERKLGSFSKASISNKNNVVTVYNLYGQYYYGFSSDGKPPIHYNALRLSLRNMAVDLKTNQYDGAISLPRLGAGLAGGNWRTIQKIIEEELADWTVNIYSLAAK